MDRAVTPASPRRPERSLHIRLRTSLFACITEIKIVRLVIAWRTSSGSTAPVPSTGRYVTSAPNASRKRHGWVTDGCSIRVVTM